MKIMNGEDKPCNIDFEEFIEMQKELTRMHDKLDHLQYLPKIAHSLETLTDKLVKPATDKTGTLLVSAVLAVVIVILVLKDTDKGVEITSSGIKMGVHHEDDAR
jgi:hypothetical protein